MTCIVCKQSSGVIEPIGAHASCSHKRVNGKRICNQKKCLEKYELA